MVYLARLVLDHPQRALHGPVPGGLAQQVQVLPGDHFRPHQVEHGLAAAQRVGRQAAGVVHLIGPRQQEVAHEDGGTLPERLRRSPPALPGVAGGEQAVQRGPAPAGVAAVHDVVVHQRAGVQQLQRGGRGQDLRAVWPARAAPAPVAERGPQPLARPRAAPPAPPARAAAPRPPRAARPAAARQELAQRTSHLVTDVTEGGGITGHDRETRAYPAALQPGPHRGYVRRRATWPGGVPLA